MRLPTNIAFEGSSDNNKPNLFRIVTRYSHRVCMSCGQITQQVRLFVKFIITVDVLYMCMTGLHASVSLGRVIGTEHHRWQHAYEY
jgi:hypothetical protein